MSNFDIFDVLQGDIQNVSVSSLKKLEREINREFDFYKKKIEALEEGYTYIKVDYRLGYIVKEEYRDLIENIVNTRVENERFRLKNAIAFIEKQSAIDFIFGPNLIKKKLLEKLKSC